MQTLDLVQLTDSLIVEREWRSSYGTGAIPTRMRWLRVEAAESLPARLVMSDIYRSPVSSLAAVKASRGALPPGYSAHNYGLAVDLDIEASMLKVGAKTKTELDDHMAAAGWYCHRTDHRMAHEGWHFNFLGAAPTGTTSADEIEARIVSLYGATWTALGADVALEQAALKACGCYEGRIDGLVGAMTESGREVFRRTWITRVSSSYHRVLWLAAESRRYLP